MPSDPYEALGDFLTAREAAGVAALLASGAHISQALDQVAPARRAAAQALLDAAALGHANADGSAAVLRAIAGAKASARMELTPIWTMPGDSADIGGLTSEFHHEVTAARISVTCASYNFTNRSNMWTALREASESPGVTVTVYVDSNHANAKQVQAQLPKATVYRSGVFEGQQVVSHAKFIVIDHTMVLLTSANFSRPAENSNVELGLRILDPGLAHTIETTMTSKHGSLYQLA
jgi:phosphatidylserine/phosphatidylglycerophosphate/cardiolipin synthase-like enzyme